MKFRKAKMKIINAITLKSNTKTTITIQRKEQSVMWLDFSYVHKIHVQKMVGRSQILGPGTRALDLPQQDGVAWWPSD